MVPRSDRGIVDSSTSGDNRRTPGEHSHEQVSLWKLGGSYSTDEFVIVVSGQLPLLFNDMTM